MYQVRKIDDAKNEYEFPGDLLIDHHVYAYIHNHWRNRFMGVPVLKTPNDLFLLQDVIWETRPDWIIETGAYAGGSALWMATILDGVGKGQILTCDISNAFAIPKHPRIHYFWGEGTGEDFIFCVSENCKKGESVMVILDSFHGALHVFKELTLLSPFVTLGQYLVVEDTNLNGNPIQPNFGPGPNEALKDWIGSEQGKCFENQTAVETKYGYSFFPGGWLKRVRKENEHV